MEAENLVLGSGPAGVAAAKALLERGRRVTLVDAGLALETERSALVDRLAASDPSTWPEADVELLRGDAAPQLGGVPLKLAYGSDFPYREVAERLPFENRGSATGATLARGGFSTVWGSVIAPYLAEDLADWPVSQADLAPHYAAVTRWLPVSGVRDDLDALLPLHTDAPRPLRPSAQAIAFHRDLERSRGRLAEEGLRFGWSRLAVRAEADARGPGCVYCGLCLHGCPHRLIYDAGQTLAVLEQAPGFELRSGLVVERLVESGDRVQVFARERGTEREVRLDAERVYVGCGVVATTRLLLASLEAWDRPVEMRDSQYFLLPLLRFRGVRDVRQEALHTLCQLFLELRDPAVCPRNVHLQIYGYNRLFEDLIARMLGPARGLARPFVDAFLGRLLLVQGYLHSDFSASIRATLRKRGSGEPGGPGVLELEEVRNPRTRPVLRRVIAWLARRAGALKLMPLAPLLDVAPAGRGFHSGGSFPMRDAPGDLECDVLGRPRGLSRVHLIDASTFPTIPSTTITFTVMANAHRIASEEV